MSIRNKINGIKEIWHFDNRMQLIISRTFFPHQPLNIYRIGNVEFLEDHANGDANGARDVFVSPMYRQYFKEIDKASPINVLDLGANNGGFPLLLKHEGYTINKLACVEFNPSTFSRMRFNIERNFSSGFTLFNVAACGDSREISVKIGGGGSSDNIYSGVKIGEREVNETETIIQGLTFDQICSQAFDTNDIIDVCKMDIEGAEFEILPSDTAKRLNDCRYVIVEIHHTPTQDRKLVISEFLNRGFTEIHPFDDTTYNPHNVHLFVNPRLLN